MECMGDLGLVPTILSLGESSCPMPLQLFYALSQYAPYLRNYSTTLFTVSFTKFEGSTDPAAELLKKTWNVATGQE